MIKNCLHCSKRFNAQRSSTKFCSRSCSTKLNNTKRKINRPCPNPNCSNQVRSDGGIYCSFPCRENHKLNEWLLGNLDLGEWSHLPKIARKYVLDLKGEQCWECSWAGVNPVSKNVMVEVHHINGDSTDNRIENLSVLCPNCHSLTTTFRNLNKRGKGRKRKK